MTAASFKELRRQYEASIARAKLEFAESGDNDKVWPGINQRQDERDKAIFAALQEIEPTDMDEVRDLLKIVRMFLQEKNQLGMTSEEIDLASALVKTADGGLGDIEHAGRCAKWSEDDKAGRSRGKPDPVKPVEKRFVEVRFRRAIDLMDAAHCTAKHVNIAPGCPGIIAALAEAENEIWKARELLGIEEPEGDDD